MCDIYVKPPNINLCNISRFDDINLPGISMYLHKILRSQPLLPSQHVATKGPKLMQLASMLAWPANAPKHMVPVQ